MPNLVDEEAMGEDTEQIGRFDASYLLRNLVDPEHEDGGAAASALAQRAAALRIIAVQVGFFAAVAAQAPPLPPLPQSELPAPPLIGVVGCGRLGQEVLGTLLALGWPPRLLGACSRKEHRLARFEALGVQCVGDAGRFAQWDGTRGGGRVGSGARLIVLCVPIAQLRQVTGQLSLAKSRRGANGLGKALVVSCVAGAPYAKLEQLLPGCPCIARTAVDLGRLAACSPEWLADAARAPPPGLGLVGASVSGVSFEGVDDRDGCDDNDAAFFDEGKYGCSEGPVAAPSGALLAEAAAHLAAPEGGGHGLRLHRAVEGLLLALGASAEAARAGSRWHVLGLGAQRGPVAGGHLAPPTPLGAGGAHGGHGDSGGFGSGASGDEHGDGDDEGGGPGGGGGSGGDASLELGSRTSTVSQPRAEAYRAWVAAAAEVQAAAGVQAPFHAAFAASLRAVDLPALWGGDGDGDDGFYDGSGSGSGGGDSDVDGAELEGTARFGTMRIDGDGTGGS